MDNSLSLKMKHDSRWYFMMSCIYGVIFTVCLYKNLSGITFPVMTVVTLFFAAVFLKRAGVGIKKDSIPFFAGIILLGISTCLTANPFFHFFNAAGIILLGIMLMFHQIYEDKSWGFTLYVKNYFCIAGAWILSIPSPFGNMRKTNGKGDENSEKKKRINSKNAGPVLAGILIALLFMMIVFPLLLMSDRVFSQLFTNLFRVFDMRFILEYIDVWNLFGILFTFLLGMIALYAFFEALFKRELEEKEKEGKIRANAVTGITFASVLAAVYVLYSVIQICFLFLRLGDVLPDGMTYSEYAHEGFWQLLFVSIINFCAVLICANVFEENKILKMLLCVISLCTCVMIVSAAYRMILYVSEYNLTFLRILVLWFLGTLMLIFFGVIYSIFQERFRLFRYITAVLSVCYIAFSFSHVDAVIASYNMANTEVIQAEDIRYMIYGLSEDAVPVIARIDKDTLDGIYDREGEDLTGEISYYFEQLREKGDNSSLRQWNHARAQAYAEAEKWKTK